MEHPALVVMAAGIGSRYGGLKQIEPIGPRGEIIIDYSVYDALAVGFERVVFIVREEIRDEFYKRIGEKIDRLCDVEYVVQRPDDIPPGFTLPPERKKPWGTAHAVLACRHVLDAPFAVINADDFYGRAAYQPLYDYLIGAQHRGGKPNYCMVGYRLSNTLTEHGHVARGVCTVSDDEYLVEIHERKKIRNFGNTPRFTEDGEHWIDLPPDSTVSMNMWGFTPSLLPELERRFARFLQTMATPETDEYLLPDLVGELVAEDKALIRVLTTNARWFGVTYREDKTMVRQAIQDLVQRGVYPDNLWGRVAPGDQASHT